MEDLKIGGPGIIVEIDECKLSKRKCERGHRVEGAWVLGGVERTPERRIFAIQVENRSAETLQRIIEQFVLEGSIIYTDCWRGYSFLDDSSSQYEHSTVNHSLCFKDPVTGIHTNSIEGTWAALKSKISKRYRCKDGLSDHLLAFIWRRQNQGSIWKGLLEALKDYEFVE
jgi:transposase-like protein